MAQGDAQKIQALSRVPLFRTLNQKQLDAVARVSDEVDSRPGETLMREGESGHEFVLVLDGKLKVERGGEVIDHVGPGGFVGEMSLLDGKPRSATIVTEEPSRLLLIHQQAFGSLLDTVPGLQRQLLIGLSSRIRELHDHYAHG